MGIADVDYNLPRGVVRLMRSDGCDSDSLASAAGLSSATILPLETAAQGPYRPFAVVPVTVDGITLRAKLDTGSVKTTMTLAAAKRLGITPNSAGVVETGFSVGVGGRHSPVWRASFRKMVIGNEVTDRPTIYIEDMSESVDILLGFDFFSTHRMHVANRQRKVYIASVGSR